MNRFPNRARRPARLLAVAALLAQLPALPAVLAAEGTQIFKCTDASGNVTYQNEACPKASKAGRVDVFDNRWSANKEEREAEWRRNAAEHRLVTGMPARWVREALGEPAEIRDTPTAGAAQLWLYSLPDRSVQVGMLDDQVLWFRETPAPSTRAAPSAEKSAAAPPARPQPPQIVRSSPPVDRPANLPVTRLAPSAADRVASDAPRVAPVMDRAASDVSGLAAAAPAAPPPAGAPAATTAPQAAQLAQAAPSAAAAAQGAQLAQAAPGATAEAAKPAARTVARGQDCKQALADLGPPSRQREVPAIDTSSDPATEYFYESASEAGRLRIVCSNGKVEGVDRSVAR